MALNRTLWWLEEEKQLIASWSTGQQLWEQKQKGLQPSEAPSDLPPTPEGLTAS